MSYPNHDGSREAIPYRGRELEIPRDIEAEQLVIAGIIGEPFDADLFDRVMQVVAPRHFFRDSHRIVYQTIQEAYAAGTPIDPRLIWEAVRRKPEAATIDDIEMTEIFTTSQGCIFADHHAQTVRDLAIRRDLIQEAAQTTRDAYAGMMTADEMVSAAEARFFEIGQQQHDKRSITIREATERAEVIIEGRQNGIVSGVATGFRELDAKLGGCLGNSQLIILAARPGQGKTALALDIAEDVAKANVPVLMISMEMSSEEIGERALSGLASIPNNVFKKRGALTTSNRNDMRIVMNELATMPLHITDRPIWTVEDVMSEGRRQKSMHGVQLIIVDYIQLIEADKATERSSRQEQVSKISRKLKVMAKALGVPVLALSQLNRESEKRADKRPMMSDLRESGAIEQDADVVVLLHRPSYYDPNDRPGLAEIIIAKNRNGETGVVPLFFQANLTKFRTMERHERPRDMDDEQRFD